MKTDRPRFPELGARFTKVLEELNCTQAELARRAGVTRGYVNALCGGNTAPGMPILTFLANNYDISLSWLLVGLGERHLSHQAPASGAGVIEQRVAAILSAGGPELTAQFHAYLDGVEAGLRVRRPESRARAS